MRIACISRAPALLSRAHGVHGIRGDAHYGWGYKHFGGPDGRLMQDNSVIGLTHAHLSLRALKTMNIRLKISSFYFSFLNHKCDEIGFAVPEHGRVVTNSNITLSGEFGLLYAIKILFQHTRSSCALQHAHICRALNYQAKPNSQKLIDMFSPIAVRYVICRRVEFHVEILY